ncbi:aldehyde dehydrogenase [Pedobacter sp. ISL-68]|uniref:aldehyde dehydrogenase n=1 Tax=unclassified Pedobacter TaxID=2628915 RepID=UPI001BECA429|nr:MULTISPECIES: aldehyde dehydrogenase [unclassified Pedobacter]MBT2560233.1 aldehyde dehydrogenase [Pedobacter sp. ISL-64]MBT2589213.1 aldehyde dehydrogenase [Pedobacter sp. ISL-68]
MKELLDLQRSYFDSNITKSPAFRVAQLKKLKRVIRDHEPELINAVYKDFMKGQFNTFLTEFSGLYTELDNYIKNLPKWSKVERAKTNLLNMPAKSYLIPEPLGVCLVIGAWNYPISLSLGPVLAAIAAGNTVILKPSEITTHTSAVIAKMIRANFDPSFFTVVQGGVKETTELLTQAYDKIFFTGSVSVGKIVYQAAALHLTPVTLELGGKSPAIIAADANLSIIVKRLVWGKFLNAGQTCIAPDYVYVHKSIEDQFLKILSAEIDHAQFALEKDNYAQIITTKHLERLIALIDERKLFKGGRFDKSSRFLEPTVMSNVSQDDKVMEDEIFGPIFPILSYENIEDVISYVKSRPKPLALYLFTESHSLRKKVLTEVSFGGGAVNEVILQFANENLPFGGVGQSGMGAYHGEAGFRCFTHYKSILQKPTWFEPTLKYYPYKRWKENLINNIIRFS